MDFALTSDVLLGVVDPAAIWPIVTQIRDHLEKTAQKQFQKGAVHPTACIEGDVVVESGAKIMAHSVVRGPAVIGAGCVVADHALVRESWLGPGTVVGHGCEVARSILLQQVRLSHFNVVLDSWLGVRASFGGFSSTANVRLDGAMIRLVLSSRGETESTETIRFGAIIGNDCKVGAFGMLMPGAILEQDCVVFPGCYASGWHPAGTRITKRFQKN